MRLAVLPDTEAEQQMLANGAGPEPFFMTWLGLTMSNALVAAVQLGIFELLAEGPRTAAEVAGALGGDPHGAGVLLEGLAGFGLLRREAGAFSLMEVSRRWLTRGSPTSMSWAVALGEDIGKRLAGLERAVRTGEVDSFHVKGDAGCWSRYLDLLNGSARQGAPALAQAVRFERPPRRMLDVGGGPGRYSIALCEAHPELEVDILELPESAAQGRKNVAEAGLEARIRYHVGDALKGPWPGEGYDVVLMSHFLHCLRGEACAEVIRRASEALAPGGQLVINDVYLAGEGEPLLAHQVGFSLVYLVTTGGRCWPVATYEGWMRDAGLEPAPATRMFGSGVLCAGHKPATRRGAAGVAEGGGAHAEQ